MGRVAPARRPQYQNCGFAGFPGIPAYPHTQFVVSLKLASVAGSADTFWKHPSPPKKCLRARSAALLLCREVGEDSSSGQYARLEVHREASYTPFPSGDIRIARVHVLWRC